MDALLATKRFVYDVLVRRCQKARGRDPETLVKFISVAARFGSRNHGGYFSDGRIEDLLLDVGRQIEVASGSVSMGRRSVDCSRPRILHVASEVWRTGGHSRVLAKWIASDMESTHELVLTRQGSPIPGFIKALFREKRDGLVILPQGLGILGRAAVVRRLSLDCDFVVLHHHPDDVIPVLAFARAGGPPVAFFNHAHFSFSLGPTVADLTVNTLPRFVRLSKERRCARETHLLFGGFGSRPDSYLDRRECRISLGLDTARPVVISMGASDYYRPNAGRNFFESLAKLLKLVPGTQVLLVGPDRNCDFIPQGMLVSQDIHIVGPVSDPLPFYAAADISLESFPFPSLGAFLGAVAYGGAFPIAAYGREGGILCVDLPPLAEAYPRARTESEYIGKCVRWIQDLPAARKCGEALRRSAWEAESGWFDGIQAVYSKLDARAHCPAAIGPGIAGDGADDVDLAGLLPIELPVSLHGELNYLEAAKATMLAVARRVCPIRTALEYEAKHLAKAVQRMLAGSR